MIGLEEQEEEREVWFEMLASQEEAEVIEEEEEDTHPLPTDHATHAEWHAHHRGRDALRRNK